MRKSYVLALFFLVFISKTFAQVGIGTTSPDPSSLLDVTATDKGVLIPRIALTNTTAFAPLLSHVAGMQVYNTATAGDVTPGQYYNDGTKWVRVGDAAAAKKNYTFLRTSDDAPAETVGDNLLRAYRQGHTTFGNFSTNPDVSSYFSTLNHNNVLSVQEIPTDAVLSGNDVLNGINSELNLTTALSSITRLRAINSRVILNGSVSSNNNVYGVFGETLTNTNGNLNGLVAAGNFSYTDIGGTGTKALGVGVYGKIFLSNAVATTTNATGVRSDILGNGNVTNLYNFYGGNASTITATNGYGFYLEDVKATNQFGIYQVGSDDKNYFAGNTGFKTNNPTTTIQVGTDHANNGGIVQINVNDGDLMPQGLKVSNKRTTGYQIGVNGTAYGVGASTNVGLYGWGSGATNNYGLYVASGRSWLTDNTKIGGTDIINNDAILELSATKKGLLLPRVALTATTAFAPLTAHTAGMKVYNTATAGDVTPGEYNNDGAKWVRVGDALASKNYAWLRTSDNLTADAVGDQNVLAYRVAHTAIGNALTNPDDSQIRTVGAGWSNTLNVNTNTTDYSKTVVNGIYSGMLLKNAATKSTGFYDGLHTDLFSDPTSTQGFFWLNGANIYTNHKGSGTVDIAMGAWTPVENSGSGILTNAYGLRTQVFNSGAGSITNAYGLMLEDNFGTVTNRWGLYQAGAKNNNYFAGHVNIGNHNIPDKFLSYGGAAGNILLSVQESMNTDAQYNTSTGLNEAIAVTLLHKKPTAYTGSSRAVNIANHIDATSTVNYNFLTATSWDVNNYSIGNVNDLWGASVGIRNSNSGNVGRIAVIAGGSGNQGSGTVTENSGIKLNSTNTGAGNITTNFTFYGKSENTGTGTIGNSYNFFSENGTGTGAITNRYGFYSSPFSTSSANNFAIYTNNGTTSLGGPVQFRAITAGSNTDEILSIDATGFVRKLAASGLGTKNYTFLRTSDNLPAETVGDNAVKAYRTGKTGFGLAATNPTHQFEIKETVTQTGSGAFTGENSTTQTIGTFSPTTTAATWYNASYVEANSTSANLINDQMYASTMVSRFSGTGNAGVIAGINPYGTVTSGGANVANLWGSDNAVGHFGTGTVAEAIGTRSQYFGGSGTITNGYAFKSISTNYGGIVTNGYGLYLEPVVGTNRYGVFQSGLNDFNHFGGRTHIGNYNTSPDGGVLIYPTAISTNVLSIQQDDFTAAEYGGTSQFFQGISWNLKVAPTVAGKNVYGDNGAIEIKSGSTQPVNILSGVVAANFNKGTGLVNLAYNQFDTGNQSSGTVTNSAGVRTTNVNSGTGTMTAAFGTDSNIRNTSTGTIVSAKALNAVVLNIGAGTITDGYGLFIEDIQATNQWGIFQMGATDKNYFAGNVGIGATSASTALEVNPATVGADPVKINNLNTGTSTDNIVTVTATGLLKQVAVANLTGSSNIRRVTAATTATTTDATILCDATTAGFTITIPTATSASGKIYTIRKSDETTNVLTFSQTIKVSETTNMTTLNFNKTIRIQSDGTNWWLLD